MDYGRPELADRLASEYVLGTLRGPARRRFESLLPAHPALRAATARWQERLTPLTDGITPVEPPPQAWTSIEQRLFTPAASTAPAALRWWQRLSTWTALGAVAGVMAVAVLVQRVPQAADAVPIVVLLAPNPQVSAPVPARFVASLSPDGRALVLRPIDAPALTAQQALELWAVPANGAPRSLGLIRADGATTLRRGQPLRDAAALAISVEPAGGSTTGAPTGPIVSLGELKI